MKSTLISPTGTNDPDTGDIYSGLDRFGRVKDNRWLDGMGADLDRIQYGYDRASNRIWRHNVVAASLSKEFDELYSYDDIHRLNDMARGALNGVKTALTSSTFGQCWTLDATGNWQGFREDDDGNGAWNLIQSRTANSVNEITNISETTGPNWVTPAYSAAGNMTTLPQPSDPTQAYTATYDAWNRLVKLEDGEETVSEYAYDGAKRRIVQKTYDEGVLDETRHLYYTGPSQWQVVEERVDASADAERQFIWGLRYIDDLLMRDRDTGINSTLDERLYACQDANWNVTALVDGTETVQERYAYSAYGVPAALSPGFTPLFPAYDWETMNCGYRFEPETGVFHVRHRIYLPLLGTWGQRDGLAYSASMNLTQYCGCVPLSASDPLGLRTFQQCISDCHEGCRDMNPRQLHWPWYITCINGCEQVCAEERGGDLNVFIDIDLGYGHFCGPTRRAACNFLLPDPKNPQAPHDELDAACERHDCCLLTASEWACQFQKCNKPLCDAAYDPHICDSSPTPDQCRKYQAGIRNSIFCTGVLGF